MANTCSAHGKQISNTTSTYYSHVENVFFCNTVHFKFTCDFCKTLFAHGKCFKAKLHKLYMWKIILNMVNLHVTCQTRYTHEK